MLRWLMVEKLTFNSLATVLVDNCQLANCTLPQLETCVALCCVTKLHIFRVAFYCPQHKVHPWNDHAETEIRFMGNMGPTTLHVAFVFFVQCRVKHSFNLFMTLFWWARVYLVYYRAVYNDRREAACI
jgi:hypothetical protein